MNSWLKRSALLPIALLLLALTGCQVFNLAKPESTLTVDQIIFFSSESLVGPQLISRINADGTGLKRLAELAFDGTPTLSPDGKKIAFLSGGNLYVMNLDGSHRKRLSRLEEQQMVISIPPAWSPDSRQLTFNMQEGLYTTIYLVNVNGSGLRPLDYGQYEGGSAWSPDGQQIAFDYRLQEHLSSGIAMWSFDGSEIYDLTSPDLKEYTFCDDYIDCPYSGGAVWSPDSRQILFGALRDGSYGIYVVNRDGSNQTRLLETSAEDGYVGWSPDGQLITLVFKQEGKSVIYTMNVAEAIQGTEAGQPVRLTDPSTKNFWPVWSPDGQKIAFVSDRDGNQEIYVMNADGSNQTRLTNTPEDEWGPVWLPE